MCALDFFLHILRYLENAYIKLLNQSKERNKTESNCDIRVCLMPESGCGVNDACFPYPHAIFNLLLQVRRVWVPFFYLGRSA